MMLTRRPEQARRRQSNGGRILENLKQHECQKCETAGREAGLEHETQTESIAGFPTALASASEDNDDSRKSGKRDGNLSDADERLRKVLLQH